MKATTQILQSIPIDPLTGAISVPIYQTSTFIQEKPGCHKGFDYSRTNNPTRKILEDLMANLEGGTNGFAFASGMAAIDCALKLLKAGDEIISVDDIYGGAFRLFTHVYQDFGIRVHYVDTSNVENIKLKINSNTKLIWLESPTNPRLKISDLEAIGKIAKQNKILFCVDNTFASPISQLPIQFGADLVLHSATKYLGGHSDLIAGLIVTANEELGQKIKFIQNATGAILAPFDSWLLIRGIETLALRLRQHSESALAVARFLESHNSVARVYYPGLENHENFAVAKRQQKYFGGIVSFELKQDELNYAAQFVSSTKLFLLAESLGGAKSLICQPCEMTHKSIPPEKRREAGIKDSLIRLSVGLEDADDLIQDLTSAFESISSISKEN